MKAIALQSGSNGNSIFVEASGVRLLFDAGISGITAERRLAEHGIDIRAVDGLIISHDHADHVRCGGVYQRKYGIPMHITSRTLERALSRYPLGRLHDVRIFRSGEAISFGEVVLHTFSTPHDGADGSVFVVEAGTRRLGIMTDLGHVFDGLEDIISSLDAVFLESNYDPGMLSAGPYPRFLKQRICGEGGHISNIESAELLLSAFSKGRLRWACLSHLSEQNNSPDLAVWTHRNILSGNVDLRIASRYTCTELFVL